VNDQGNGHWILNYEDPEARAAFTNYLYQVALRYRDRPAIGAGFSATKSRTSISGNPRTGLWATTNLVVQLSRPSRRGLRRRHRGVEPELGTAYAGFDSVPMPRHYPASRHAPAHHDLIQWRKQSIATSSPLARSLLAPPTLIT